MDSRKIDLISKELKKNPKIWLVTGVAGFIGSNLLEGLLDLGQRVVGLDNFETGYEKNLIEVMSKYGAEKRKLFTFIQGDIRDIKICLNATTEVDYVLHQAALGSVPRSIADPLVTNAVNVDGFLNVLNASRINKVKRFVYASSSSVYGDSMKLPKEEAILGGPLSPYAVTKLTNELYASAFKVAYNFDSIGLRYFNVFGPRQNPQGAYAAVIPRWIDQFFKNKSVTIFGDGSNSRDFCFIKNVVQANILAATTKEISAVNQIYNIAAGQRTTLIQLYQLIQSLALDMGFKSSAKCSFESSRNGDVLHSLANLEKVQKLLGYDPIYTLEDGLRNTIKDILDIKNLENHSK